MQRPHLRRLPDAPPLLARVVWVGLAALVLLPGCGLAAYNELTAALDGATEGESEASGSSGATTGADVTASASSGPISTVTTEPSPTTGTGASDSDETGATSTGDPLPDNLPPKIHWMTAKPTQLSEAGPVVIDASMTADVVAVEVYADDALLTTLTPAELPYPHVFTSAKTNGEFGLWIRAVDQEGLDDVSASVDVHVELPASGTPSWTMTSDDAKATDARAIIPFAGGVAIGGAFLGPGTSTATVRYYDETNTLRWIVDPVGGLGLTTAVALAPDGTLVAAGMVKKGLGYAPWLARINSQGGSLFDTVTGNVGETATGVAVAGDGSIYVSGYVQTADLGKYDAMLWAYSADAVPKWVRQWDNPDGVNPGDLRDQAMAVAVALDETVLVGGTSEFLIKDTNIPYDRALALRYAPNGDLLGSWVAGDYPAIESGGFSIAADVDGGILIGGWSSSDPKSGTRALALRLDAALVPEWFRVELGPVGFEEIRGIGRLPEGDVVTAATRRGELDLDLVVSSFAGPLDDALWSRKHTPAVGDDEARGLALGPYGAIYYVGVQGERFVAGKLAP